MPVLSPYTAMVVLKAMPGTTLEASGDILFYDADTDTFRDGDGDPVHARKWIRNHEQAIKNAALDSPESSTKPTP